MLLPYFEMEIRGYMVVTCHWGLRCRGSWRTLLHLLAPGFKMLPKVREQLEYSL
jgi:hypothetical protein